MEIEEPVVCRDYNQGPLTFSATVHAEVEHGLGDIEVSVSYRAIGTGDQHNQYEIRGTAHAAYDTLNTVHYILPLRLKVRGLNGAPSFETLTDATVVVDQNQHPLNVPSSGIRDTCTSH